MNTHRLPLLVLLAAVAALTSCKSTLPRVAMDEFERLLADRRIAVVDVRTREEYAAGHIPGAVSIPVDELDIRVQELRALGRPIVAYCSCLEEEASLTAVATLNRLGIRGGRALTGGYPSWAALGRRVVAGQNPL